MEDKKNYQKYLQSDYWKTIKTQVYKRDKYKCRLCGCGECLNVHHRTYKFIGNEDIEELITLCKYCHSQFHKTNYDVSYTKYCEREREKQNLIKKTTRTLQYQEYMLNYKENFENILKIIDKDNFITIKEFESNLNKFINKKFDYDTFVSFVIDYYNLIYIWGAKKDFKQKYNFPKRIGFKYLILVKYEFYTQHEKWLSPMHNIY